MITVQKVSKFLGKKELFEEVSFHIHPGEKIGLIGHNGAGKSTLFNIILGETEPDSGTVIKSKNLRLGHLPQQWAPLEGKTVLAHAMDIHGELHTLRAELHSIQHSLEAERDSEKMKSLALQQTRILEQMEHLGGYDLEARAQKILAGLGFKKDQLQLSVSALSGGWVMRLELARLLLAEPDLLLLDEPTNHLDLSSLLWLEQYLQNTSSAMMIISHDRTFLNSIVKRILELEGGQLNEYTGNYDDYLKEKSQRQEILQASYRNQQERIRQIERFVERNRVRASGARQAQSRLKMLDKIERIDLPAEQESAIHFTFPAPSRSGKRVLELSNVHKSYGEHTVYEGIDLVIERGDRVAFIGENGAGKSTLLKMLAGVEEPTAGRRIVGHQALLGYYAQYQWEQLQPDWTVLEEASSVSGDMPQSQLRSLLGAFLFRGEDVLKRVSVLSGGEKARLILCKLLLQRPNVLLLDEPTNHLDIPSRDVLERALAEFPGTICFISHDRHFINALTNKVLAVDSGKIHLFPGNYNDFHNIWKKRLEENETASSGTSDSAETISPATSSVKSTQERKRQEAEWRNELHRRKKPLQEQLEKVENTLEKAQKQLDHLNALLADPSTYQDGNRIQEVQKEYQESRRQVQRLTEQWEEHALALEELEKNFQREKSN
ncbi:ABC-F family ATP-binding cassette domain-containing protein [Desulforhabdus amnigena]|uniref:ABC transporter ATP-binding protein n=1 Tax=Desulforhabdus amnigena TaxID=40218 RepID=A0A9W6L9D8_9BACT|nr:ABC-F family ATP-binding cassette domain-containing protein [Desulforhabdus amnigena]GLI36417.1 ABC transporter ATP-binding protein [Desulforhabdus amnigena]